MWTTLILGLCLLGCFPKWAQKAINIKYNRPFLSSKGGRHDGYYIAAFPFYKYKNVLNNIYDLFVLYEDNTYLSFGYKDSTYTPENMFEAYWGIYNIVNDTIKIQYTSDDRDNYLAPWVVGEYIYIIGDTGLKFVENYGFSRKGKEPSRVQIVDKTKIRFIPSSNLPLPNSWLKKEKWMYE